MKKEKKIIWVLVLIGFFLYTSTLQIEEPKKEIGFMAITWITTGIVTLWSGIMGMFILKDNLIWILLAIVMIAAFKFRRD